MNIIGPILCLLLASCGKLGSSSSDIFSSTPSSELNQNETILEDGSNIKGTYAAEIWPMNYNLHFKTIGVVGIQRSEDSLKTMTHLINGPKNTTVKQALYTARRCPNLSDDLNKDAFIDIVESQVAIGKITIPFDGDLNSQAEGFNQNPFVDETGKMFYSQTASFEALFQDLKAPDENPMDELIKLEQGQGMTLPGRIVLFQGIPQKINLPETVATIEGHSAQEVMPVGCAILWKVSKLPKELEDQIE